MPCGVAAGFGSRSTWTLSNPWVSAALARFGRTAIDNVHQILGSTRHAILKLFLILVHGIGGMITFTNGSKVWKGISRIVVRVVTMQLPPFVLASLGRVIRRRTSLFPLQRRAAFLLFLGRQRLVLAGRH